MSVGKIWPSETTVFQDERSGATVRRLTNQLCHSHHLYFTNPGWFDDGRRMLVGSDRTGGHNLFAVELSSGQITQLTAWDRPFSTLHGAINPGRDEGYFYCGQVGALIAIDLHTGAWRPFYRPPEGFRTGIFNVTADGRYLCTNITERQAVETPPPIRREYYKFRERMEARPLSKIVRIDIATGAADVVHEERCLISHVNTSPTRSELLSFCHEGPWHLVDHRIWVLNHQTGEKFKVRPRESEGERIGHEYWYADGIHIGYHGTTTDGRKFFGRIRYDNTDPVEVAFPHPVQHVHSNDLELVVADGGSTVKLWKWNGSDFDGPRILCEHWCSPFVQICHVHPRFNAGRTQVVFTSNTGGYGNVFLADVPEEFQSLPALPTGEN